MTPSKMTRLAASLLALLALGCSDDAPTTVTLDETVWPPLSRMSAVRV